MVKRSGDIYEKSANIQKWKGGHGGTDSLLLVPLAKMRSIVYGILGSSALARVLDVVND